LNANPFACSAATPSVSAHKGASGKKAFRHPGIEDAIAMMKEAHYGEWSSQKSEHG
jgi:hypothetical protein